MVDSVNTSLLGGTSGDKVSWPAALSALMRWHELNSDQLLPAIVKSFNRADNLVTVKPAIDWIDMKNKPLARHELVDLNALSLGGGGFHISFPIKEGDLGWIFASDRDIELFKSSLNVSLPNTGRAHKFEDALFIPDVFRKYMINGEDSEAMVIQSVDGATRISIRGDNIKITAPVGVVVDTPITTFTGDVKVNKNLTVDQDSTTTGNNTVEGLTTANGGFTAEADGTQICQLPPTATIGGIVVLEHGHEQNGDSGRTSGGMEA